MNKTRSEENKGFSLVEVMIAIPILAIAMLVIVYSLLNASLVSKVVSNKIAAKNVAQGILEKMTLHGYDNVTPANYPNIEYDSPNPMYLDEVNQTKCRVIIRITGYGTASAGSSSTLENSSADWIINEWAGDTLFIIGGRGWGQIATISSNNEDTLTLDSPLIYAVDGTSQYLINGGKTIEITTEWKYKSKIYQETVRSAIIHW